MRLTINQNSNKFSRMDTSPNPFLQGETSESISFNNLFRCNTRLVMSNFRIDDVTNALNTTTYSDIDFLVVAGGGFRRCK
jgi:hypothetical protein